MHHGELLNKSIKTVTGTKVAAAGTGIDVSGPSLMRRGP